MRRARARLALLVVCLSTWPAGAAAAAVPPGFEDRLVVNVEAAVALAFTPDGRILIARRTGILTVYQDPRLVPAGRPPRALDLSAKTCIGHERGMTGLAVDPDFGVNQHIYLYYTFKKHNGCPTRAPDSPVNRVSRFTLGDDNRVDPASEVVLIDNIPSYGGNHNGGDLAFGPDGHLYVGVGDGGCDYAGDSGCAGANDASRDQHILLGKILRITVSGGIPPDNPFRGADSARCAQAGRTTPGRKCQETFAWGLRNPFRFAFDPNAPGTRFFVNDVGDVTWEEVNLGRAGADYGWNVREGHCARGSVTNCGPPPAGMTNPIHDYPRSSGCAAITGAAFVPRGVWPSTYDGGYLFGDYVCGKIRLLKPTGASFVASDFATDVGPVIDLLFGPDGSRQALYYTTWKITTGSEVRRIALTSGNRSPVATARASTTSGAAPLGVFFDGSASTDADGDALTYDWDFGDGSPHASGAKPAHIYSSPGTYTAVLRVHDGKGGTDTQTLRIDAGNTAPVPTISSPTADLRFRVGQPITLRGTATDAEDGTLVPDRLSWEVLLHHNTHVHPFLEPTAGNDITLAAPPPENLTAAATSHLEVKLTATDSKGLIRTVSRDLRPRLVDLTFVSQPGGMKLELDGTTHSTPVTVASWEGYAFGADARLQPHDGATWYLAGGRLRITTPSTPTTFTATFARCGGGLGAAFVMLGLCSLPYWRRRLLGPGRRHGP